MAKATRKDTPKARRRRAGSLKAVALAVGSPTIGAPALGQALQAVDLEVGRAFPGDSPAQASTRRFLCDLMRGSPTPPKGKTKDNWRRECMQHFRISRRGFDRVWDEVIARTSAVAYGKSGPR
jgi:hypothetical protein